jgi:hypothetical protein
VIIKEILNFYQQLVQINVDADTDYAYNTANKYQSEADKLYAEVERNKSINSFVEKTRIGPVVSAFASWVAPVTTTAEYIREGLGYFYNRD